MPRQLDLEKHFAEAKRFSTRSEFSKKSQTSYQMLWRHGLLDEACAHMAISPIYSHVRWTHDSVFFEASKYKNRAEFKRECSGAYCYALENRILETCCSHMRDGQRFWHIFELMAVAIKYTDKAVFTNSEMSAYTFCKRHSLVDLVCAHMHQCRDWSNKVDVLSEASKYQSRGEFRVLASAAYKRANAGGYLDEACAHMPPPEYGFSKEKQAVMYFLRVSVPGVGDLFKIGITNRDPLARVAGMGAHSGVRIEVMETIFFDNGRDARIAEKRLHRKFAGYRYAGAPVMKNGNTELFTVNVLDT